MRSDYRAIVLFILFLFVSPAWGALRLSPDPSASKCIEHHRTPERATLSSSRLVEEFSFLIKDFKLDHQNETNNLNITIRYRYKSRISESEYPDFRLIAKDVETFLLHYPNENDYWEILNKKLTVMVLKKYTALEK